MRSPFSLAFGLVCRRVHGVIAMTGCVCLRALAPQDFGPEHVITDRDGEPMKTLALRNCEVIDKPACLKIAGVDDGTPVVILTFAGDLGPSDVADITQLGTQCTCGTANRVC